MAADADLVAIAAQIEEILAGTGCELAGFGPNSVAVMGDARFYGPCVCLRVPPWVTTEQVGQLSTKITNEVKGISRVLVEINLATQQQKRFRPEV